MVVNYNPDRLSIEIPDFLVLTDLVIGMQNTEQGIDCHDWVTS